MTDKTDSKEREAFIRWYTDYVCSGDRRAAPVWDSGHVIAQAWKAGRASLAASAGSEPVAWTGGEEWEQLAWHLCAEEHGEDACDEVIWEGGPIPEPWGARWMKYESDAKRMIELVRRFYTHPSPPEGMVGGWIASKDQMPPPGVRVFWGDADSNRVGYDSWAGDDYRWTPSHWMHIPEFCAPPTSSADSRKGE